MLAAAAISGSEAVSSSVFQINKSLFLVTFFFKEGVEKRETDRKES